MDLIPHRCARAFMIALAAAVIVLGARAQAPDDPKWPTIEVTHDDTVIDRSCYIEIDPFRVIEDLNGNGVLHIVKSDITVIFAGGVWLRGAPPGRAPDQLKGRGIVLDGVKNVTLRQAHVAGFRAGVVARQADNLTIDGGDLSDNYCQHLKSTPEAEDASDWLYPHDNDKGEWLTNHGAALAVSESQDVTIKDIVVHHGQNGVILDRVMGSSVKDCNLSFNSGWGVAMWRSSNNTICRNKIDYCIRGYSHGVYNRGQDSAGLLMFEQCGANNVFENSITHCGDGVFAFGGNEALNTAGRAGCNDNSFSRNELSYAAAHGLELTFSFGNSITRNHFTNNAICGIWGGYSQDTTILANTFNSNGDAGYGLERGGINIEHGFRNLIVHNKFQGDRCGVHLWETGGGDLLKKPWAVTNHKGSRDNAIIFNDFTGTPVAIHLRSAPDTGEARNDFADCAASRKAEGDCGASDPARNPTVLRAIENNREAGAGNELVVRAQEPGRESIIMTEWGPWDGRSPLVQAMKTTGGEHVYMVRGVPDLVLSDGTGVKVDVDSQLSDVSKYPARRLTVVPTGPGPRQYRFTVTSGRFHRDVAGLLINMDWQTRFFATPFDPRTDDAAFDAAAAAAPVVVLHDLHLPFGSRGPGDMGLGPVVAAQHLPADHFGITANTTVQLPRGTWKLTTVSDDGIRVSVDGKRVISDWTWHVPTTDTATFTVTGDRPVVIEVSYFELTGSATLLVDLTPMP